VEQATIRPPRSRPAGTRVKALLLVASGYAALASLRHTPRGAAQQPFSYLFQGGVSWSVGPFVQAFRGCPVRNAPLVGFCGSRCLSAQFAPLVRAVVAAVQEGGQGVAVGCAAGADSFVRSAAPGAQVFRVSAFGQGRAAFARRSAALVRAVAASGAGARFFGFVSSPCPVGVFPSLSPSRCFCGGGSGSWASLALAVGLRLPVSVFWCSSAPVVLPAWPGSWSPHRTPCPWALYRTVRYGATGPRAGPSGTCPVRQVQGTVSWSPAVPSLSVQAFSFAPAQTSFL
jgi:hypothetical protein